MRVRVPMRARRRCTTIVAGQVMLYREGSVFATAELAMGRGNSGKLVTEVKSTLTQAAPEADLAVIDGSPGIGCPVIASISGVDLVLIVTEPPYPASAIWNAF